MAGDEERLFVSLEARITDFEKKMAQAERRGTRTYSRLRQDSAAATKAMEADMTRATGRINQALAQGGAKLGAVGKAWAAGLVGGVVGGIAAAGVSGIVGQMARIANGVATVGDEARRAGVSAKAFQEWKFVAEQNRIGIDAMVDGLKELNLRADEFAITGKGSAAEAFQRLGYSAEEVKRKLEDPSALLLEIIGRLEEMDKAAQIRIADELFGGTAGERFVELLDQGEAGIRNTIAAANELGVIMDDELIAKAAEVDRQFGMVSATVGTALKGAIVSAAAALADFISQFMSFQRQTANTLRSNRDLAQDQVRALNEAIANQEGDLANLRGSSDPMAQAIAPERARVLAEAVAQRDAAAAERDMIQAQMDRINPPVQFGPPAPGPTAPTAGTWTSPASPPVSGSSGGGGGGGSRTVDDLAREMTAIQKRTEALKAGTLAQSEINPLIQDFGRAAEFASARTELLVAAQQAGLPITDALREKIDTLAAGYADAAVAANRLDASQEQAMENAERAADLRRDSIGGFAKDLLEGADAADAFASALKRVGDRMLDLALDQILMPQAGGGAAGGNIFGGILGGIGRIFGFASGTANTGGSRGEPRGIVHGQEAVIPLPSGGRVPVEVRGASGGQGDGKVKVEVNLGKGLEGRILEQAGRQAAEIMSQGLRQFARQVPGIVANNNKRQS